MRRPPGLWILLSAGVLWLSLQDVYGIRATALIFGKSSTTTTTTEAPEVPAEEEVAGSTEASLEVQNTTKVTLSGVPQIDYIYDPNLPKELNGYNLSEYPFYERVPEDIDFKCDGLHDGFYASVPHKCQVYHHCLFGTRYDFLCANYTAFDQKTFICHFVSEVDCVNSKKFWHRNDALYQAQSTTTVKPIVIYTTPADAAPLTPVVPRRPIGGGRRRPFRRRRPQYEYYEDDVYEDDYYVERPRANRRRKRPRPRPIYDDYEDEYEEDRYDRRGANRREEDRKRTHERRDEERRPGKRNKDRRKFDYEEESEERYDEGRKSTRKDSEEVKSKSEDVEEKRFEKRRPEEQDRKPNRKNNRRPIEEEYEEDLQDESSADSRPFRKNKDDRRSSGKKTTTEASRTIIKPVSGTIYDRPRVAPRIKLPVPKNEADKYAYKPLVTQAPVALAEDDEYYDDYEEEALTRKNKKSNRKPESSERVVSREDEKDRKQSTAASRPRTQSKRPVDYDSYERPIRPKRPKYNSRPNNRKRPAVEEYYDYEEETVEKERSQISEKKEKPTTTTSTTTSTTTTTTTTTTTERPDRSDAIVRIVKRPFLPSRGGNPFAARGLQPVGTKALDKHPEVEDVQPKEKIKYKQEDYDSEPEEAPKVFKPSPVIIKVPVRQKFVASEEYTLPSRSQERQNYKVKEYSGPRTTQKPNVPERDPLDLNEYDVTLNDALNPTLPNLPVRSFPTGFSSGNDYTYSNFQRSRYVLDPVLSASTTDYAYQGKPARQQQHGSGGRDQFSNSNVEYKGQYSTISGQQNFRPRHTQVQTHAYFTSY